MINFNPKFKMFSEVKHISKGSPIGIIVDISYLISTEKCTYKVAFLFDNTDWHNENDLIVNNNKNIGQ